MSIVYTNCLVIRNEGDCLMYNQEWVDHKISYNLDTATAFESNQEKKS